MRGHVTAPTMQMVASLIFICSGMSFRFGTAFDFLCAKVMKVTYFLFWLMQTAALDFGIWS